MSIYNLDIVGNELILKIPLLQKGKYTYSDDKNAEWEQPNICGLIWGDEYSIASLNYLDYKDDLQCGMPILMIDSREELESRRVV